MTILNTPKSGSHLLFIIDYHVGIKTEYQSTKDLRLIMSISFFLFERVCVKTRTVWLYTGLGRGPYGGRHLASCPPSGPQFQARGWTSSTFAHCKLTNFIFIIAYNCFQNLSLTNLNFFLYFCLHNVLIIFS